MEVRSSRGIMTRGIAGSQVTLCGECSSARIFIEITSDPRSVQHVMMSSCSVNLSVYQTQCTQSVRVE